MEVGDDWNFSVKVSTPASTCIITYILKYLLYLIFEVQESNLFIWDMEGFTAMSLRIMLLPWLPDAVF